MSHLRQFDPSIVREFFEYLDGDLIWKPRDLHWFASKWAWKVWNKRYPRTVAGYKRSDGYLNIRLSILGFDSSFRASHLVWVWHHARWLAIQLDHIDHDRANNRINNLREVSSAENQKNRAAITIGEHCTFGVSLDERYGTWVAKISADGRTIHLGSFSTEAEAIAARRAGERLLGYHPNHGKRIAA